MEQFPQIVTATIPNQAKRFYLVEQHGSFIPEVKALIDQKVGSRRVSSPGSLLVLCNHLRWYYRFLQQRKISLLEATPSHFAEFTLWLSDPYRLRTAKPEPLGLGTIKQIQYAIASFYKFLVRRGYLAESPVVYEEVSRYYETSVDNDLLGHLSQSHRRTTQRMEMGLKVPQSKPKTVSPDDFETFVKRIHVGQNPDTDPSGFRDRLIVLLLRETGLRSGELLGIRMEDLDFGANGIHVRFRPNNENGARAKAGYGRDRFVSCPAEIFALLDVYISEIWVNANFASDYLWLVLQRHAVNGEQCSTFGKPLTGTALKAMFVYYSKQSGVKIHPHMLRHTHATDLVRSYVNRGESVDWTFISNRLGHSSVNTTMEIYTHLTQEDGKNAYKLYLTRKEEADARRRQRNSSME